MKQNGVGLRISIRRAMNKPAMIRNSLLILNGVSPEPSRLQSGKWLKGWSGFRCIGRQSPTGRAAGDIESTVGIKIPSDIPGRAGEKEKNITRCEWLQKISDHALIGHGQIHHDSPYRGRTLRIFLFPRRRSRSALLRIPLALFLTSGLPDDR